MPTVVNLDTRLGLDKPGPLHTKKVKMMGREWTIVCDLNQFAMASIASGEYAAIITFVKGLVIDEEQEDFIAELSKLRNLSVEKMGEVISALIEVAGERPTSGPSPSRATAKKKTSSTSSRAR